MSEMVERVARAIATARGYGLDANGEDTGDWQMFVDHARAAIEAMREPTEAMWREASFENGYVTEGAWQAMIDAALNK